MRAVQDRDLQVVQALVDSGADIHARDHSGLTPTLRALQFGDGAVLRFLLSRGGQLGDGEQLSAAVVCGDRGRAEALAQKMDPDGMDRFGRTPLGYATMVGDVAMIELFLRTVVDPKKRCLAAGQILLSAAIKGRTGVIDVLLRGGADVNVENDHGSTPLMTVLDMAKFGLTPERLACVRALVNAGARFHHPGKAGTVVYWCALKLVAGSYDGFGEWHAQALAILLDAGGETLICQRGAPALLAAARWGHARAVEMLVRAGTSPDARDAAQGSALAVALAGGHFDVVDVLLAHGARVPSEGDDAQRIASLLRQLTNPRASALLASHPLPAGYPPSPTGLAHAIAANDLPGVERLIHAGVDCNADLSEGETALTLAARHGYVAILRACAARGAAVDARHKRFAATPLAVAVLNRQAECAKTLIALGCDVNAGCYGRSPLWDAAERGLDDMVRLLLDAGADPCRRAGNGTTPLTRAATHGRVEMMDLFLSAIRDPARYRGALKYTLLFAIYDESIEAVRLLLDRCPDIYDEPYGPRSGERPIYGAAVRGNAAIMRLILSHGPCTLTAPNGEIECDTPLMAAVLKGNLEAVRVLVEAGADVRDREQRRGYTPLLFACCRNDALCDYPGIVAYLLDHGAEVDARANDGRTALLLAAEAGLYGVVRVLLSRGTNVRARDHQGRDALAFAEKRSDPEVAALLRQHLMA